MSETPIWPIIATVIIGFTAWSENGSQNCTQKCNNSPKVISDEDTNIEIIDKILFAVNNQHKIVHWRRVIMVSIILSIIIVIMMLLCNNNLSFSTLYTISGFQILMIGIILFIVLYFTSASMSTYWWQYIDENISKS